MTCAQRQTSNACSPSLFQCSVKRVILSYFSYLREEFPALVTIRRKSSLIKWRKSSPKLTKEEILMECSFFFARNLLDLDERLLFVRLCSNVPATLLPFHSVRCYSLVMCARQWVTKCTKRSKKYTAYRHEGVDYNIIYITKYNIVIPLSNETVAFSLLRIPLIYYIPFICVLDFVQVIYGDLDFCPTWGWSRALGGSGV